MVNAGQAVGYLDLDFSGFSRGLKTAQDQLSTFTDKSNSLGDRISGLGGAMKTAGASMSKYFTVPILGAGIAAGKMAMDTEHSMSKVNSILQLGGTEFQAYEKTLKQGASEIGLAYNQYADAAYDAISAGVEQGKVTEFLTGANKLAKGGLTDLTSATNLLTTVQNAYGLEQKDLAKVSDILIQTQNKGKVTVDELSSSMGKIIPTAKSLGVGVDQLGAGYAIMTAKGIASAEATTYMNSMFNELGKSGTNADKVLKKISGQSFQELTESGKSTGDILQMLSDHAAKSGKSLSDMFGSAEAGKAALTLMSDGAEGFNGMLESMNNSAGSTDAAFKEMNSTMKEQLSQSFSNLKNALSDLGTSMEPVIRFVAEMITNFSNWVSMMAQTNPGLLNLITILAGVLAATGPLLIIIGQMAIGIGALTNAFSLLSLAKLKDIAQTLQIHLLYAKDAILKGLSTAATWAQIAATTAWNAICLIATTVTTALGAAIAFLTSPIGLVILAIGALIAIGVLLYKNWDVIKAKATEIWQNNIKPTIDSVMQFLGNLITSIWNGITTFLTGIWNGIKDTATNIWNGIKNTITSIWEGIKSAIQAAVNVVKNIISTVFDAIKFVITTYVNAWKTVISTAWNLIQTVVSTGVNTVKNTITRVWSGLQSILTAPFTAAKSVIDGILGGISSAISSVKSGLSSALDKLNPFKSKTISIAEVQQDPAPYSLLRSTAIDTAQRLVYSDSIARSNISKEDSKVKTNNTSNTNNKNITINNTYNSPKPASIRELKKQDEIQMRRLSMQLGF